MQEIVINNCYGGFSLSKKACKRYEELSGNKTDSYGARDLDRNDPHLVQVVKELGQEANGSFADLSIVEVPDDVKWQIEEYDGSEWVAEVHRTWR